MSPLRQDDGPGVAAVRRVRTLRLTSHVAGRWCGVCTFEGEAASFLKVVFLLRFHFYADQSVNPRCCLFRQRGLT